MVLPTKHIKSENPYEKMWDTFVYFESESTTKSFLQFHYENITEHPKRSAYDNASKFIYFIKQAKEYYTTALNSHILVKPLLLYYGMMSLMKAVILKHDPVYPSNTGVLRHGMTTRKLKKSNYSFRDDEIKIQKDGLLPHFTKLIYGPIFKDQPKYKFIELISLLPELKESYERVYKQSNIHSVQIEEDSSSSTIIRLNENILDLFHMTANRFEEFINQQVKGEQKLVLLNSTEPKELHFVMNEETIYSHPRFVNDYKGNLYFLSHPESLLNIPESCIHFIIMYQLGMLCRYETELWGELIYSFQSDDTFIINEFLNLSTRKFPNLILNLLFNETLIFDHH